jgi:hypothetical protein
MDIDLFSEAPSADESEKLPARITTEVDKWCEVAAPGCPNWKQSSGRRLGNDLFLRFADDGRSGHGLQFTGSRDTLFKSLEGQDLEIGVHQFSVSQRAKGRRHQPFPHAPVRYRKPGSADCYPE